jgi:hypothetical protein
MSFDTRSIPESLGAYRFRQDVGIIESAPLIENVLLEDSDYMVRAIYDSDLLREFFLENKIELLDFGGGEFGISVPIMLEVPTSVLRKVKLPDGRDMGLRRAKSILKICADAIGKEPHY